MYKGKRGVSNVALFVVIAVLAVAVVAMGAVLFAGRSKTAPPAVQAQSSENKTKTKTDMMDIACGENSGKEEEPTTTSIVDDKKAILEAFNQYLDKAKNAVKAGGDIDTADYCMTQAGQQQEFVWGMNRVKSSLGVLAYIARAFSDSNSRYSVSPNIYCDGNFGTVTVKTSYKMAGAGWVNDEVKFNMKFEAGQWKLDMAKNSYNR